MTAPIASGWSESPGGPRTHWKAPPFHGARRKPSFLTASPVARTGHEDPFPRPGPNGRCRFGQETFAGVRGNGQDAPIADLRRTAMDHEIRRDGSSDADRLPE